MNIRTIRTSKLAWLQWAMSTILKPAVRAETEWNRETRNRWRPSPTRSSLPARRHSTTKISNAPATMRNRLVLMTRRLRRLRRVTGARRPRLRMPRHSRSTPKPMPPRTMQRQMTVQTRPSSRKAIILSGARAKPALQKAETAWNRALNGEKNSGSCQKSTSAASSSTPRTMHTTCRRNCPILKSPPSRAWLTASRLVKGTCLRHKRKIRLV